MKITGVNHLALVCRDMAETVRFYTEVLQMPLVKTVALPDGGQHMPLDVVGPFGRGRTARTYRFTPVYPPSKPSSRGAALASSAKP